MLEFPGVTRRFSAKICGFLREKSAFFGALCHLKLDRLVLVSQGIPRCRCAPLGMDCHLPLQSRAHRLRCGGARERCDGPSVVIRKLWERARTCLEAQQRYFSYRAILVAIVSQNSFVLVLMGYRTIIARYVAKWGIAQVGLCETKCRGGGGSHHFGGAANLP